MLTRPWHQAVVIFVFGSESLGTHVCLLAFAAAGQRRAASRAAWMSGGKV